MYADRVVAIANEVVAEFPVARLSVAFPIKLLRDVAERYIVQLKDSGAAPGHRITSVAVVFERHTPDADIRHQIRSQVDLYLASRTP